MFERTSLIIFLVLTVVIGACVKNDADAMKVRAKGETKEKEGSIMIFEPVVAGQFYTGIKENLEKEVERYIFQAKVADFGGDVMGVIAPHAGYIYSGPVAGYSYLAVKDVEYDVVVVMGPSHRAPGAVSVLNYDRYKTPLGQVVIDKESSAKLIKAASWINDDTSLFAQEHSLEVQLPFLQKVIPDLKVVMISMGTQNHATCVELAAVLEKVFAGKKALFVASSDMSHFLSYEKAKTMDLDTLGLVDDFEIEKLAAGFSDRSRQMCGSGPVLTLLELYKLRGGNKDGVKVLKYQNSGDTAGDKNRVVGYGAVAFVGHLESKTPSVDKTGEKEEGEYLTKEEKETLLKIARETVTQYITKGAIPDFHIKSKRLLEPGAAFVTLHKRGNLRGCIGQIIARIPLWKSVREMAVAAASQDPRFPKVKENEISKLHIEVSVLTPPKVLDDPEKVVVGKHGLIMSRGMYRGLLLPQVPTEWGWDRETFLNQTCKKAGMRSNCWKDSKTKIETFEAIVFSE